MKKILLLPILFINSLLIYCQAPTIQWQKSLGGTKDDKASSIQQTTDGGYIIAGTSSSNNGDATSNHGSSDYWIVKLDNSGIITWQKSLGGTGDDIANSIQQTRDGGYIIVGTSNSNNGNVTGNHGYNEADYWVVKLDNLGVIQWQKTLGGSSIDEGKSIQQTTDGGYIVAGNSSLSDGNITGNKGGSDFGIIKLDSTGIIQWQKSLGGTGADIAHSIQQTIDGGYIVAGTSYSQNGDVTGHRGQADCWIVKLDNLGTIQWQKTLGGTSNDEAESIKQTTDGGYIVAGCSESNDGDITKNQGSFDVWVIKIDSIGTIQWQSSIGGTKPDYAASIQQTTDGEYIVAGHSLSSYGDLIKWYGLSDYWVVKLSNTGVIQWQKSLGGTLEDEAHSIQQTIDEGYIVAGYSYSNNIDVTDHHVSSTSNGDYWIVKLNASVGIEENSIKNSIAIFPNPSVGQFYFSNLEKGNQIEVFDLTGKLIFKTITKNNSYIVDLSEKENGIYFYKIIGDNNCVSGKLIKQ